MNRRLFLKSVGLGLIGVSHLGGAARSAGAAPKPPPAATVALCRADHVFLKEVFVPAVFYPEGKVDYAVVQAVVDGAMASLTGERRRHQQWARYAGPQDRVGIMVDTAPPATPIVLVECIVDRLISAGVREDAIFIFSASEQELYATGYSMNPDSPGVQAYATDTGGFRNDLSRLLLDRAETVINLARLRPEKAIGVAGALHNHLCLVPATRRVALRADQELLPSVAALRAVRDKVRLHLLDALNPAYDIAPPPGLAVRWPYAGLLASEDAVALDAVGARLLEAKRAQVRGEPWPLEPQPRYLRVAQDRYALGVADLKQIQITRSGYSGQELLEAAEGAR